MTTSPTPPFLTAPALDHPGLAHGFFGRAGGVSNAPFASLNTGPGSGDAPEKVAENRKRCAEALGVTADRLLTVYQIHSPEVVIVDSPWPLDSDGAPVRPKADALITTEPGLAIGALAADCMPVLMADTDAGVIAAAHAGWRGALAGVLEAAVAAMTTLGAEPKRIVAAFGPCMRQPNFEVGPDLVETFTEKYADATRFFIPGAAPEKSHLDLVGFGKWRLSEAGVVQFDDVARCTLGAPEDYFSYRASRRAGDADYGRNLSAIALVHPKT